MAVGAVLAAVLAGYIATAAVRGAAVPGIPGPHGTPARQSSSSADGSGTNPPAGVEAIEVIPDDEHWHYVPESDRISMTTAPADTTANPRSDSDPSGAQPGSSTESDPDGTDTDREAPSGEPDAAEGSDDNGTADNQTGDDNCTAIDKTTEQTGADTEAPTNAPTQEDADSPPARASPSPTG